VPHSIFTGRPWPRPGEPLFLQDDTDLAVALALEERDTCPSCGLPKAWCRNNDKGRASFDVSEEMCWATRRLAIRQDADDKNKVNPIDRRATQLSVRFRPGYEPDIGAGLNISPESGAS
jgi:hypothetical protein